MNQVVAFYNPYLPELKVTVNGKKLSPYSSLMSFQHQRLEKWCDCLFTELYREVNSDYEMLCVSTEFACEWMEELADSNQHCVSFISQPLPLDADVYQRLEKLELLGCDEVEESIVIPLVNVSDNSGMTDAVYDVIDEQGIFEDVSHDGITWSDCPLVTLEINPFDVGYAPYEAPVVIALCGSEEDYIRLDTDAPIYALVMDTETRFLRRQGSKLFFSVDPDDIGKILLEIIEEETLCPLVSQLSYDFPEESKEFLTESEREDLELVCQASPVCNVILPKVCDVGRTVKLDVQIFPSDSSAKVRVVSDSTDVIDVDDEVLLPRMAGIAEVSAFISDDPYPVATEQVNVRKRRLITDITLFPSMLYMSVGDESNLKVTIIPEDAENLSEIRWKSDDHSVATVGFDTGVVSARDCGHCTITAYTEEASKSVSLEVQPEIEDIVCPCSFLELGEGEQREWKFRVIPDNAYGIDFLRISTTDRNIAEYRGGYIIARSTGECKIYVRNQSGTISRELRVSVRKSRRFR
ncbi:MAG: Ig-like domain-containing protein [Ruminococcus sp.]|nr:Ig-like domain-containing protein [Ruminococcus sp.]